MVARRGSSRSSPRDIDARFSIYAENGAECTGRRRNLTSFSTRRPLLNSRRETPDGMGGHGRGGAWAGGGLQLLLKQQLPGMRLDSVSTYVRSLFFLLKPLTFGSGL